MGKVEAIVVGAGAFGLCAALTLARAGLRVTVLDRAGPGAGASGGPVGALAPHLPEPWTQAKAFQRDALLAAAGFWAEIAEAGGLDPGYGRIGRLIPLARPEERERAASRAKAAAAHWPGARWDLLDPDEARAWLDPAACAAGAVRETLTARIDPPAAMRALAAALRAHGGAIERAEVASVAPGGVRLADGKTLAAPRVVLAAGVATGDLVPLPGLRGVKGQALRVAAPVPEGMPLVGGAGLWIVPHADGTTGIGSTSEAEWEAEGPDAAGDDLLARAAALCPWLRGARPLARWAGIRPRGATPEPVVGPVRPGLWVATGGYKIGLALAPAIGALVGRMALGDVVALPAGVAAPSRDI